MDKKPFLFLGSSVTYGSAADGVSFADLLAEEGFASVKLAVSGTTLVDNDPSSYVSRLVQYAKTVKDETGCYPTPSGMMVQLSTNDATAGKPLGRPVGPGGSFDTSTVCGAIEYILSFGAETLDCPVSFYTGTWYDSSQYEKMVDLLLAIAREWGIRVLDLWNDPDMRAVSKEDYARYMADPIHPTLAGYREWWLPKFRSFLSE